MQTDLPVSHVLGDLKRRLIERDELVLQAPPGSGKTTVAPLALLDQSWLAGRKILMLEPRRIAARAAAYRMAELLGEKPGGTVGYRMRLDSRVGPTTRLEVITEGILTRMLQEDPSLADVALVIFDEFHERSLDADLALTLCLKGRELFRGKGDPLKLLVMSATLDAEAVAKLLDDAPIITAEGRPFPVEPVYLGASRPNERVVERVVAAVMKALKECPDSSLLVFLPGQGEIERAESLLQQALAEKSLGDVDLRPMYGNLSIEAQQAAIAPSGRGHRKVVLATNIAETSLTIEGVDVVVDSGLVREAVYDPNTGMTRLHTKTISRASAEQRMGRAGRLNPGKCYRLWSASQQQALAPRSAPEILSADLVPLALQLFNWGAKSTDELRWLDDPPAGAWQEAVERLVEFKALDSESHGLTETGRAMAGLPVHPRLARLLLEGSRVGRQKSAALLAAALSERNPIAADNPDLADTLAVLSGEASCPSRHRGWLARIRQLASRYESSLSRRQVDIPLDEALVPGFLVATAYPDRIARRRHSGGYQLANGRAASLAEPAFGNSQWLAVAEVGGLARRKGDVIRTAAVLDESLFDSLLSDTIMETTIAEWDKRAGRFVAEHRTMIGSLVINRESLDEVPVEAKRAELVRHIRSQGSGILPWTPRLRQWQARVGLLRELAPELELPDLSDPALMATLESWLGPWLDPVSRLDDFGRIDLHSILASLLSYQQQKALDDWLPERIEVPSGSRIQVDYTRSPPVLAVKLQEMFGCEDTPAVGHGRVPLLVHLLSPAGRPVQVTQDLAGFWRTSYEEVKKEMKGRYPRHIWPDDPLVARPTRKTTKDRRPG